jgi:hypothetical protein
MERTESCRDLSIKQLVGGVFTVAKRNKMNKKYRNKITVILLSLMLLTLSVGVALAHRPTRQTADVLTFADFSDVGDAWLHRGHHGITAGANVQGAEAGVYTMWWVVWNTPEGCGTPWACMEPDLFNAASGVAIGYAGGRVVGPNGRLHIAAHLQEGATLSGFPYPEFQAIGLELNETTLIDTDHAEVHLVLHYHGEAIPALVESALHTFNGACVYDPPITGTEPTYGLPGPNTCVDTFFSVFPSPAAP